MEEEKNGSSAQKTGIRLILLFFSFPYFLIANVLHIPQFTLCLSLPPLHLFNDVDSFDTAIAHNTRDNRNLITLFVIRDKWQMDQPLPVAFFALAGTISLSSRST